MNTSKAPDKIYLHKIRDEESSGFYKMWFEQRARCVPSEEYIRKDLLLEWAKELTSEPYNRTTESALKHQIAHYLLEKYNSL